MKRIFLSLSLLLAVGMISAFAEVNTSINVAVQESFKKEFPTAQFTEWNASGELQVANFVLGGRRVLAYFSDEGDMLACVRDLFFDQLPLAVMTAVDKRFSKADIIGVQEITNGNGTSYRITLESENRNYLVKADATGNIESEKLKK